MEPISTGTHNIERFVRHSPGASRAGGTEDLATLIDHATIAMEAMRTQWRTAEDLGTHERMAISQLRIYGSMPMSELAARISLSRAAVTSLVDRLEADGWVERRPDEHDRRRTCLHLLPQAAARFDAVTQDFRNELQGFTRDLSDDELAMAVRFLRGLTEIAERQAVRMRATAVERSLG